MGIWPNHSIFISFCFITKQNWLLLTKFSFVLFLWKEKKEQINWNSSISKEKKRKQITIYALWKGFFFLANDWTIWCSRIEFEWVWIHELTLKPIRATTEVSLEIYWHLFFLSILLLWIFFMFIRMWQQEKRLPFFSLFL